MAITLTKERPSVHAPDMPRPAPRRRGRHPLEAKNGSWRTSGCAGAWSRPRY